MAKVVKRLRDEDGKGIGTASDNPLHDTRMYEVRYSNGETAELQANIIAENMFNQIDSEGYHYQLLCEIQDHSYDLSAIPVERGFITTTSGNKVPKKTTRGWELLVEFKDGSSKWVKLKHLKASNPVELAEYAVSNGIEEEPAFKWWVKDVLRRRDRIVSKVKSKYWRTTHQFGIRVPKSVDEAYRIDKDTNTTYWTEAIKKEMKNCRKAFEKLIGVTPKDMRTGKLKPGYKEIKCHMIFTIKMDGKFTRKARYVAGGHLTDPPASITYSSVVSRDSVRMCFLIASLNDLDICAVDLENAYLNAKCREKVWCEAGAEFGDDNGSVMIIVRALYGLKSAGAAWRALLARTIEDMGFVPCIEADPDVYMKEDRKANGDLYYRYLLVYVDDLLSIGENAETPIDIIGNVFSLKAGSKGPPERYLGAGIEKLQKEDGTTMWSMNCREYLQASIERVKKLSIDHDGIELHKKLKVKKPRPLPKDYHPELDTSKELDDPNIYQQLIGILRWACELGRIDILTEVSVMSQHMCNPREGHLAGVFHIFAYLDRVKRHIKGNIGFDAYRPPPYTCPIKGASTQKDDWMDFYPDSEERLPRRMPKPLGKSVVTFAYVDANHAGNLANRRSHTGILVYVNNAPIMWFSKRQNTVESSSFGSEFVALRIAVDMIENVRFKLRCFGVQVDGPAEIVCDNKSVVTNSSVPSSILSKRHNAICYHRVREAQSCNMVSVMWIKGEDNFADLFSKTTIEGNTRYKFVKNIYCDHNTQKITKEDQEMKEN